MKITFIAMCAFFLLAIISPFFKPTNEIVFQYLSSGLTRNYFSAVSSVFGIFFAIMGLMLGYFYYENRKRFETEMKDAEYKRKHLDILMDELNEYDILVHKILTLCVVDDNELRETRSGIERHFERIESMLEQGLELLNLSKDDMEEILRVNSFVDKCELLFHSPFCELDHNKLYPIKDRYIELMKRARRRCYLCIK